jgi:V/A-type H+-transporting ATPase subunit E
MGVEKVTRKIAADADARSEEILTEARRRSEEILARARDEISRMEEETERLAGIVEREETERHIALATLENRKAVLREKRTLIERAFEQALEQLASRDKKAYQRMIRNILLQVVESGDEEVIISDHDRSRLDDAFLRDLNATLAKKGRNGALTIPREAAPIRGGFLLRSGRLGIDCSLDALLDTAREELEIEVSRLLFGENE